MINAFAFVWGMMWASLLWVTPIWWTAPIVAIVSFYHIVRAG